MSLRDKVLRSLFGKTARRIRVVLCMILTVVSAYDGVAHRSVGTLLSSLSFILIGISWYLTLDADHES